MQTWAPSGLEIAPQLRWGSHLAHFFGAADELRDVLVPYFKAGLENHERCLWVTGRAFNTADARAALGAAVSDLDSRERNRQIEIIDGEQWYSSRAQLRPGELLSQLLKREHDALAQGYQGQRSSGNCAWVSPAQWPDFMEYERLVQKAVPERRMICICSYCSGELDDAGRTAVTGTHDLTLRSRHGFSAPQPGLASATSLERQKRTFDLAMAASDMGTWRYTLADNMCVYDDNAQRLYGLTGARFLHDAAGVKEKFHPDDIELMWSRVLRALDPSGDGRYDVEYRVRQLDGGWRWLSAWGLVEFEDEGSQRRPVAISGASRDLTQQKQTEELQHLLLNEMNHRVKNTAATIHAITSQTLRTARDLPSAKIALDQRIRSLARAHDLLAQRAWTGANLADVVKHALDAFSPAQLDISCADLDIPPRHALALSLVLHELATNAVKYGALSCDSGRVALRCSCEDGTLSLHWEESGGPVTSPPARKGFGSRLIEELAGRDLGGAVRLSYDVAGVRCSITAPLK